MKIEDNTKSAKNTTHKIIATVPSFICFTNNGGESRIINIKDIVEIHKTCLVATTYDHVISAALDLGYITRAEKTEIASMSPSDRRSAITNIKEFMPSHVYSIKTSKNSYYLDPNDFDKLCKYINFISVENNIDLSMFVNSKK